MKECDLIMKGGITSGVVYPRAIIQLSKRYRFRSIGGTSAGAIGAVMAAAAEYRRQSSKNKDDAGGFDVIDKIPIQLGRDLQSLFQPTEALTPLFGILIALINDRATSGKALVVLKAAATAYFLATAVFALASLLIVGLCLSSGLFGWALFAGLAGVTLWIACLVFLIYRAVTTHLPANHFGLCTGLSVDTKGKPAFTNWMADLIDTIATDVSPVPHDHKPLTVGDLRQHGVEIASMTTDLSTKRPYQLPLEAESHYFSEREFRKLFPKRIVDYLVAVGVKETDLQPGEPNDLYNLAVGDDMPVLLVARLSLSFPGLISATPLHRRDRSLAAGHPFGGPIIKCIFSDGGISSNFPVHFFDSLLPSRPTFGISLADYVEERHGDERTWLPQRPRNIEAMPIHTVASLGEFIGSIFMTAKDWQDTLQSVLPGYAERIVEIRLDSSKEGGLNLTMEEGSIKLLTDLGEQAGASLVDRFDETGSNEHRFRRALNSMPVLEDALLSFSSTYEDKSWAGELQKDWPFIFEGFSPSSYKENSDKWRKNSFHKLAKDFAKVGKSVRTKRKSGTSIRDGAVPQVDADLRVLASANRVPKMKES